MLRRFRRLLFAYEILTPAALKFFVEYADGAVESLWSIDQYFQFVLVLLMSTGLSFQVRFRAAPRNAEHADLPNMLACWCTMQAAVSKLPAELGLELVNASVSINWMW